MPTLREKGSGRLIGRISDRDLQFLIDQLEEESSTDRDYYVDEATIQMLEEEGAPAALVSLLRSTVADHSEGLDIAWTP
jgi:processive 1,2-diacylglycerol beta-glucosyltransferase